MTTCFAVAVSLSFLFPSVQDPQAKPPSKAETKSTRSVAAVLEMGTGKGSMVMLARRVGGALQVQEIERGADDVPKLADADRKVLAEFPKEYDWTIRTVH